MVLDGIALLSKVRFGATSLSEWTLPAVDTGPPSYSFEAGDLCLAFQLVEGGASIPDYVTPTGWTALNGTNVIASDGNGRGVRVAQYVKIMTALDVGAKVVGMTGVFNNRVCGMALHFNRPLRAAAQVDASTFAGVGGGTQGVASDGLLTGAHLLWGAAIGVASVGDSDYSWTAGPSGSAYVTSVAAPDLGSASVTRSWYTFYPQGATVSSSVGMTMSDMGAYNALSAVLLRLT